MEVCTVLNIKKCAGLRKKRMSIAAISGVLGIVRKGLCRKTIHARTLSKEDKCDLKVHKGSVRCN